MTNPTGSRRIGVLGVSLALVFACLVGLASAAHADTVTITETATVSGSLDGVAFTDALVILEMIGNTSSITNGGGLSVLIAPATVSVSGGAAVAFTDTIEAVVNQTVADAGFGDVTNGFAILFTSNPAFSTATLTNLTGPVSGPAFFNGGADFATVGGTFDIASAEEATFTSTVTPNVTPESSSLPLLGTGLLGLFVASRKLWLTQRSRPN